MLREIYVKNFILIDDLHLDFANGLSAFIGETGAGKSLLIDAISLLCGERANSSYVAHGKDYTFIEGVFELDQHHPVILELQDMGIEVEDELIITRKITSEGKSSVKLNHQSITLSTLKRMMNQLVDIHSQHDTQYLLNSRYHLNLLDNYGHYEDDLKQCESLYHKYDQLNHELKRCEEEELNPFDLDYLKYQIQEIDKMELSQDKIENLNEELKQLNSFEKLNEKLSVSYESLRGNKAVLEQLYEAIHALESLSEFEWCKNLSQSLNECYYTIEDISSEINHHLSSLEVDENRVNMINAYLYDFNNLKRKYGMNVESILAKRDEFIHRIEMIENRESYLLDLRKRVNDAYKDFEEKALILSSKRHKKAKELEKAIVSECRDLYLENTRFEVRFISCEANKKGLEKVEFYISMNPGEPLKSLCDTASGGELSRLMLGLKTIFTDLTSISTIIFDEIDTGVSGKVALAIGQKMREIGNQHQLFAITHLPSVAASAHHHYAVEKIQSKDHTKTVISQLNYEQVIQSLSSMISTVQSDSSMKAAEELYKTAQQINE